MASNSKDNHNLNGFYDTSHHLVERKIVPDYLVLLRDELALPQNAEIVRIAKQGKTFEECLALLAAELSIILDGGFYDVGPLCEVLFNALSKRHLPLHLRDVRLEEGILIGTADGKNLQWEKKKGGLIISS